MPFLLRPRFLQNLFNDGTPYLPDLLEQEEYERRLMWTEFVTWFVSTPSNELVLEALSERFETILGEYKDLRRAEKQCAAMA